MNTAIQGLIQVVSNALSTVSPFYKAVSVAVTALVSSLVNMAFAGSFDTTSIVVLGCGLLSAVIAYFVPNQTPAAAQVKKVASVVPPVK